MGGFTDIGKDTSVISFKVMIQKLLAQGIIDILLIGIMSIVSVG